MNRATPSTGWARNPDGTLGWTWNPITGCLNHTPEGLCLGGMFPCYAFKLANGRLRSRYLANQNVAPLNDGSGFKATWKQYGDPFYPRSWFDRRERGLEGGKAKGVFVCDMSDLFGIGIPESWTECVLETIKVCPEHRFYLLTKQPQNLVKFSPFPPHVWVGVTVTTPELWQKAILYLHNIKASIKYLSLEPCLFVPHDIEFVLKYQTKSGGRIADQVIIGAQTNPTVYPELEWVEEIVRAADRAGVKVFLKDNLKPLFGDGVNRFGGLRQEMPAGG